MECWLVRHGESTWNLDERLQGGQDPPLSRRGQVQAAALAARLAGMAFTGLYTSPMTRARETAAACAPVVGLTPEPVDDLREMGLGAWEGLTVKAVQATGDAYRRWIDAPADHPPPGGEPLDVVVTRTGRALERVGRVSGGGPVLVVSHGGVIASLLCRWLGLSLNELWRFRLANASITRVVLPAGRLIVLNDTSHLIVTPAGAAAP
jgi:broad specificity phosphatase PhoE